MRRVPLFAKCCAAIILIPLLSIGSIAPPSAVAEPPQMWSRMFTRIVNYTIDGYHVTPHDKGLCVAQTIDGGFVVIGVDGDRYYPPHTGGLDKYTSVFFKIDYAGRDVWEKNSSTS